MDKTAQPPTAALFQTAVEASPSGMVLTDSKGTILLVNREIERLFGFTRSELLGRSLDLLVPKASRVGGALPERDDLASEAVPLGDGCPLFGVRKDGQEVPIEVGLRPIHRRGEVYVLSSIVDLSERQAIEDRLRQAQKLEAIGTLAGGIAHDFNNILLSIVGYAELSRGQAAGNPLLLADLDQVIGAAERGRELVERILAFSRRQEIGRRSLALELPVREAVRQLRASLPSTIEIRESIEPQTPDVLANASAIRQIVMNLATNATQAMPEGGVLEVALRPFRSRPEGQASLPLTVAGEYALLSVADNGSGMSPEVAERIFEPFFTTHPRGEQSGLGLSVIHGIVESHGGAIQVWSRPGQGTRFDVYLPASAPVPGRAPLPPPRERVSGRWHLLVVEDDPALAEMQKRRLESLGYRVTAHTSSVDALAEFANHPQAFDVLVTDNSMPELSGLALTAQVHALRPELPVLMISGLADSVEPTQLAAMGIRRMLRKPHTLNDLESALRQILAP